MHESVTQTRARVLAMAQQYGYQPNAIARTLNNRQSRLVAVVVNAIVNQCEAEQLELLVHRLQARALVPIILCCGDNTDRLQLMRLASTYQVDHAIICLRFSAAEGCGANIQRPPGRLSSRQNRSKTRGFHACVSMAQRQPPRLSTSWSAMVAGTSPICTAGISSWIDKQRRDWFSGALARHGLAFEAEGHGDYSYDSGFKEASLILHRLES